MEQQQWMIQTQQHYQQQPQYSNDEIKTLWIGDLQYWVDENYLHTCFSHTGEVVSIKVIRNKLTGYPEGYGFVEFVSHSAAERILQTYNGTQMPNTEQLFRLNWASFGLGERRLIGGPDHSIFVGDLALDVTDYLLQETFRARYTSVRGAKVVTDPATGRSKGYGFVKFADENERNRSMTEMNGVYCSMRPMRISAATPKKSLTYQQQYPTAKASYQTPAYSVPPAPVLPTDDDLNNTTIFVGGLDPNISEEDLKQLFGQFGELVYVKIPVGKGCGFVQFGNRVSAEEALQRVHGTVIGQQTVRLSWGRSPATKQEPTAGWGQAQADPNQWNGAYYGYGQGYEAYGYAQPPQDPSMYGYGAYPTTGSYQQTEVQEMSTAGVMNTVQQPPEHKEEEIFDPLAPPDVEKLNAAYIALHEASLVGRHFWLTTC
ncbi:polyadenylate-binding protein RBP47B' [Cryptomeria japonica]|uniref:polyadenylate-binding protein RBP47B' n=1 Tax=Cryptomeria japonica TaxID=3369 RepID=UPI0025AC4214|nr:polyadenylate-binding protein RBP47B' [Cryptomeria japonica]